MSIPNKPTENTRILVGLDLGQQNDFTVLSCIVVSKPEKQYHNLNSKARNTYFVPFLCRVPLNKPYPQVVSWASNLAKTHFHKCDYTYVVDYTGVGRPIVDMLRQEGVKVVAVNTTGGIATNWKNKTEVNVPKKDIVTSLRATMENKRLLFSKDLPFLDNVIQELASFKKTINKSINLQFEAKYGYHDDIVMSVGLAIWYGESKVKKRKKMKIITWN